MNNIVRLKHNARSGSPCGVKTVVEMSVEREGIQTPTDERQTEARKVQDFEEWEEGIEAGGEAETAGKHEE